MNARDKSSYRPITWREETGGIQISDLNYGRIKYLLMTRIHGAVTRHELADCFQLMRLFVKDSSLDPYILFRLVMILIESCPPESVDKNATVYLESQLNKLKTLYRPEVFVEFLSHFMKYNYLEYFNEIFSRRQRYIHNPLHRKLPFVVTNMHCYDFLYHYLNWQSEDKIEFDISIQGWLVNLIETLQNVQGNYEYFVKCFLEVLLYYKYDKKAYLYMSQFYRDNPQNLSAQLLMNKLLVYLCPDGDVNDAKLSQTSDLSTLERRREKGLRDINNFKSTSKGETFHWHRYPVAQDREILFQNIRKLDPSRDELIKLTELIDTIKDDQIQELELLMDGLEYVHEITNLGRWEKMRKLLVNIMDADLDLSGETVLRLIKLWRTKYFRYWTSVDFVDIFNRKRDKTSTKSSDGQVIQDVLGLLEGFDAYGADAVRDKDSDGDILNECNLDVESQNLS